MKKIRGILIDTRKGIAPTKINYTDYNDIVELLGCRWITCVIRCINGVYVDVYCDEEALLKPAREPAIITRGKNNNTIIEVLYGNCFICLHKKNGEIKSLPYALYDKIMLTQAVVTTNSGRYQILQAEM